MHWFTAVFLIALALATAVRLWLSRRHIEHVAARRDAVPAEFSEYIALAAHQKAADYTTARTRLGVFETLAAAALLLGFTLGGGLQLLFEAGGYAHGIALIVSVALVSGIVDLPFGLYRTFVIEARFGFNRMSLALFLADLAKLAALGALLGIPLVFFVLWLMAGMGSAWWLYVWLAWVTFNLLLAVIYPTLIAPLFNRFSPLEDAGLRARIESLLAKCGFRARPVRDGRLEALEPRQRLFHRLRRGQAHRAVRHADFAPRPSRDRGGARARAGAFRPPSRVEAPGARVRREPRAPVAAGVADRAELVLRGAGRTLAGHGHGAGSVLLC